MSDVMLMELCGCCCEATRFLVSIILLGGFVCKCGDVYLKHTTRAWTKKKKNHNKQQSVKGGGVVFFGEHWQRNEMSVHLIYIRQSCL